ncbi:MAG: hypothetical protein R3D98_09860 [Candidatus Krumholzibacteriia bacterium]
MVRWFKSYGLIALMVLVVTLMHYNTAMHIHAAHGIYRRLYYFPIIIAAFRGGRTAGLATAVVVCAVYLPHAFGFIGFDPAPTLEKILEMALYVAVGLVAGVLEDRERRARRRLQDSSTSAPGSSTNSSPASDWRPSASSRPAWLTRSATPWPASRARPTCSATRPATMAPAPACSPSSARRRPG